MSDTEASTRDSQPPLFGAVLLYATIVVFATAGLVWVLRATVTPPLHSGPTFENSPVDFEDFHFFKYASSGDIVLSLSGDEGKLFNDGLRNVKNAQMKYFRAPAKVQNAIVVTALSGDYLRDEAVVRLAGKVAISGPMAAEDQLWNVGGESLTLNISTGDFSFAGSVFIKFGGVQMEGVGLQGRMDPVTGRLLDFHLAKHIRSSFFEPKKGIK
jgi:LPS export ABC transporter protein LptC